MVYLQKKKIKVIRDIFVTKSPNLRPLKWLWQHILECYGYFVNSRVFVQVFFCFGKIIFLLETIV